MKNQEFLEKFIEYMLWEKNAAKNTIDSYRNDLERYLSSLGSKNLADVRSQDITEFIHLLDEQQLSSKTIARNISAIKSFHRFLVGEGQLEKDPTLNIEAPKYGQKLPIFLNPDEIEEILEQPDIKTPLGLRDRTIIEFLYATGVRVAELISIKLGNLFLSDSFIRVFGKGSKERLVPIGEWAVEYTNRYLKEVRPLIAKKGKSGDVVFLNHRGLPLSRMGLWKILGKYIEAAGITKKASAHTFRHSFATHLHRRGANIRVVQEFLGHADIATTQIYTHLHRDYLQEVHRKYHPLEKEETILLRQSFGKAAAAIRIPCYQKKCSRCGKIKDLQLFYRKISSTDRHDSRCKDCDKELRDSLSPKYLKGLIQQGRDMKTSDIPKNIVNDQRAVLRAKRKGKKHIKARQRIKEFRSNYKRRVN